MTKIVQKNDNVLRQKASEIPLNEINSTRIQTIIRDMQKALGTQSDGVALAAPQIGQPLRIFIVSKKAFSIMKNEDSEKSPYNDLVCINPRIIKRSKKTQLMDEGCLSVRGFYGNVERSSQATIEAYDEKGIKFTRGGAGLLAQIFQHEIDHLDGILFIDKAKDLEEIPIEQ